MRRRTVQSPRPILASLVVAIAAGAHAPEILSQPGAPLFASHEPLEATMSLPLRTLIRAKSRRPVVEGTFTYVSDEGPVTLEVEVTTRGFNRLEMCRFPPLRVNFRRRQVEDTLFAGQNRIKLVTHCSSDSDYVAYLEREYIAYRILNIVSEYGYRVRKFQIRYEDTERDNVVEGNAFFIEDVDGVAARLGTSELEVPGIPIDELDREWQATLAVFQYLIANTDWAVTAAAEGEDCCHNMGVLAPIQRETGILTIPYDFDQSGFVNTAYATPPPNLPIRSVRQRMYRGLCVSQDYLGAAIDRFNQSRPEIEALFSDAELDDTDTRDALSYLAAGYEVLNDPEQRAQQIEAACRG